MAIRFMAPAHGQLASGDAAGTDASFFDDDADGGSPRASAAPFADAWSTVASAPPHAAFLRPQQRHSGSAGGRAVGQAPLGPFPDTETARQRQAVTWTELGHGTEPADAVAVQPADQPQRPAQRQQQQARQPTSMRADAEQLEGMLSMGIPFRGAPDDDELFPDTGSTSSFPEPPPIRDKWLPAPTFGTSQPYAPRVMGAHQPFADTVSPPPVHASGQLQQAGPAVSSLGPQSTASPPVAIAFSGTSGAADDDAAFEFASLTPRGEEPGSPLAVGSWSNPAVSLGHKSFRLPPSSTGDSPKTAAESVAAMAAAAAAAPATRTTSRAIASDPAQSAPPPVAQVTTRTGGPEGPSLPSAAASVSVVQSIVEPPELSSYGASAPADIPVVSQPSSAPPSPRPPRSPIRAQGAAPQGPSPAAASTGVAKFRGWQHGKRAASGPSSSGGAFHAEGRTEAPPPTDRDGARRERLPPAHSTSLDRWLPPLQTGAAHRSDSDAASASRAGPHWDVAESVEPGSPGDPPVLITSEPRPAAQNEATAASTSSVLPAAVPADSAGIRPASIGVLTPAVSTHSTDSQPQSAPHERKSVDVPEGHADACSLTVQLADTAAQLAQSRAEMATLRLRLQQRDAQVAGVEEQHRAGGLEAAALKRQVEEHQAGEDSTP